MQFSASSVYRLGTGRVGLGDANLTLLLAARLPFTGLEDNDRIYPRLPTKSGEVICVKHFLCRDQQVLCGLLGADWILLSLLWGYVVPFTLVPP